MSIRNIAECRAIVTGASSGIGRAVALELARQGATVLVTARREDRLKSLAAEIAEAGGKAETLAGDLTDPAVRTALLEAARARLGGLDLLINNAGAGAVGLVEQSGPDTARRVMELNFFALVDLTQKALPLLREGRRPMIVNISSVLGYVGVPYCAYYRASKAALQGYSQSLRAELAADGIDVLVVCPGTTETEFTDNVLERTAKAPWASNRRAVSAEYVARRTVRAIRRGRREIVPYRLGVLLIWLQRLVPGVVDYVLARYVRRGTAAP